MQKVSHLFSASFSPQIRVSADSHYSKSSASMAAARSRIDRFNYQLGHLITQRTCRSSISVISLISHTRVHQYPHKPTAPLNPILPFKMSFHPIVQHFARSISSLHHGLSHLIQYQFGTSLEFISPGRSRPLNLHQTHLPGHIYRHRRYPN